MRWRRSLLPGLSGLFALGLQIRRGLGPLGIKGLFSPADLLLPFLIAAFVFARGWSWPASRLKRLPLWLVVITILLLASLLWGRILLGHWSAWAVINKVIGWAIVVSYLYAGLLMGADPTCRDRFMRWSILAGAAVAAGSVLLFVLRPIIVLPFSYIAVDAAQRIMGLQANPNAYALLTSAFLIFHLAGLGRGVLFPAWLSWSVGGVFGLSVLLAGSRSSWAGLVAAIAVLAGFGHFRRLSFRRFVLPAVIGSLIVIIVMVALKPDSLGYLYTSSVLKLADFGATDRMQQFRQAVSLWLEHPVVGNGLGTFFEWQKTRGVVEPQTIHNTALWLLTETGILGLCVFTAFLATVVRSLWPLRGEWWGSGLLATLALFAVASLSTEVMYQRHLWLLLGLALAVPRQDETVPP